MIGSYQPTGSFIYTNLSDVDCSEEVGDVANESSESETQVKVLKNRQGEESSS